MNRKIIIALAIVVLAICLISGGCKAAPPSSSEIKSWKDMLKMAPRLDSGQSTSEKAGQAAEKTGEKGIKSEQREIKLYFAANNGQGLVVESRNIARTEGIARSTLQELIKGPEKGGAGQVFPPHTRLLDINITPEGLCIADFSSQAAEVESEQAEKLLVYSVAATLSQFPSVKEVAFRINGEDVSSLHGWLDLSLHVSAQPRTRF